MLAKTLTIHCIVVFPQFLPILTKSCQNRIFASIPASTQGLSLVRTILACHDTRGQTACQAGQNILDARNRVVSCSVSVTTGAGLIMCVQVRKLQDKVSKCQDNVKKSKEQYELAVSDINNYNSRYQEVSLGSGLHYCLTPTFLRT